LRATTTPMISAHSPDGISIDRPTIGSTSSSRAASRVITTPLHGPASKVPNSRPSSGGMFNVFSVCDVNGVERNDSSLNGRCGVSISYDCVIGRLPGTDAAHAIDVAPATSRAAMAPLSKY